MSNIDKSSITVNHDDLINEILKLKKAINWEDVCNAFLYSLSTRKLEYRSIIASCYFASQLKKHPFIPDANNEGAHNPNCQECSNISWGIFSFNTQEIGEYNNHEVLNYERKKYGGLRHNWLDYIYFDLKEFNKLEKVVPTSLDIDIFKNILEVIDKSQPKDRPTTLSKRLTGVLKSNKYERDVLIDILACIHILEAKSHDRNVNPWSDWTYVDYWLGEDKYNKEIVNEFFGSYI